MRVSEPNRVLVTRSVQGASSLAGHLRALGLSPILVPAIATVQPQSFAALDAALDVLESFHWLLFTSATAVEALTQRLKFAGRNPSLPANVRIAAIGPATARAASQIGFVTVTPADAVAEALLKELLGLVCQPDGSPTRFLLVRAEEARDVLPEGLRDAGAQVTIAPAYRTILPAESKEDVRRLFAKGADYPDAITFTSSSTVRHLLALCEAAEVRLPESALRISIGPITSQTLRDAGLPAHAEAPEANVASLAEEVRRALQAKRNRAPA